MRRRIPSALYATLLALVVVSCTGDRATTPSDPGRPSLDVDDTYTCGTHFTAQINALYPEGDLRGGAQNACATINHYMVLTPPYYLKAREVAGGMINDLFTYQRRGILLDPNGEDQPTTDEAVRTLVRDIIRWVYPDAQSFELPPDFHQRDGTIGTVGSGGGTVRTPSQQAAIDFPQNAVIDGTVVLMYRLDDTPPLQTEYPQYGPYYQIDVFPSQPMVAGITVAFCADADAAIFSNLQIAKQRHADPTRTLALPRVDPGDLVLCYTIGQGDEPADGRGGSVLRLASRLGALVWSAFAPGVAHAVHLGIGGRTDGASTDDGFSPFGTIANQPPVADAGGPYAGLAGSSIQLSGSGTDPEGKAVTYAWDFGDGSPISHEQNPTHTYAAAGTYTATLTVRDADSGFGSDVASVTVSLYAVQGFFQPVLNPDDVNRVKAGRAIPLKFSLGGDQGLDIFAADSPGAIGYKCDEAVGSVIEETTTANASGLQYDAGSGQYIYVWKTDAAWAGSCRKLVMTFKDGQVLTAFFNFTR